MVKYLIRYDLYIDVSKKVFNHEHQHSYDMRVIAMACLELKKFMHQLVQFTVKE